MEFGWAETSAVVGSVVAILGFLYSMYKERLKSKSDTTMTNLDVRLTALEKRVEENYDEQDGINDRFDTRFKEIEDSLVNRIERVEDKIDNFMNLLIQYFTNKDN